VAGAASRKPRIFFGWWIILGGMLGMLVSVGFNHHGLNAFILPLSDSFGVALPTVIGVLSVARIETAFIGPVEGYLVDRFGPRKMMVIGVPLMGLGFIAASLAPNFPMFVGAFLLGVVLGSSLGFGNPISTAVANWWRRNRGRAFGLMWIGTSLASMIVPAINWLIELIGWRGAFRVMGLLVFLIGLPVAAVMRHRPEQYGMLPDGDDPNLRSLQEERKSPQNESTTVNDASEEVDFTIWEALRTRTFWYFAISVSMRTGITTAVAVNSFPLIVEQLHGTPGQASFLFLLQGICSAPGRVFLSWAGDSINKRYIMAGSLIVMSVTLLLMSQATSVGMITVIWVPYAIVWGGLSSLPQSLRADLFGRRNFAMIQGTMSPMQSLFSFITPVFAALLFNIYGSYEISFLTFAGMSFIAMVLILGSKPPMKRSASSVTGADRPV